MAQSETHKYRHLCEYSCAPTKDLKGWHSHGRQWVDRVLNDSKPDEEESCKSQTMVQQFWTTVGGSHQSLCWDRHEFLECGLAGHNGKVLSKRIFPVWTHTRQTSSSQKNYWPRHWWWNLSIYKGANHSLDGRKQASRAEFCSNAETRQLWQTQPRHVRLQKPHWNSSKLCNGRTWSTNHHLCMPKLRLLPQGPTTIWSSNRPQATRRGIHMPDA